MSIPSFLQSMAATALVLAIAWSDPCTAQSSPAETRMREQLRQTATRLREVQDENQALKAQLQTLQEQAPAPARVAPPRPDPGLQSQLRAHEARASEMDRRIGQSEQALAQWKTGYEQAATAYRTRDADAKRLEAQLEHALQHDRACVANNVELVQISKELIQRYKDKALGEWIADREPLTQLGSVRLEQLAQDYRAKVADLAVPIPSSEDVLVPTNP